MTETVQTVVGADKGCGGLVGKTVVVIGGSAGIGFETARRACLAGAEVVLTGRDTHRLQDAARRVEAASTASFDATEPADLQKFFDGLAKPIDHLMVTAGGSYYAALSELDFALVRAALDEHLVLPLRVARHAAGVVRPGGTVLYMTGTDARRPSVGSSIAAIFATALPAPSRTWRWR